MHRELANDINWLELRAIRMALLHFQHLVEGHHIRILTDNVTAKAHINREGGTRSRSLMEESARLFTWAEHISGTTNLRADWLSRQMIDQAEWRLHPSLFRALSIKFGCLIVDCFASQDNAQLPRFFTRFPCPAAKDVDALHCPWPPGLLYASPPSSPPEGCSEDSAGEGGGSWSLCIGLAGPGLRTY